MRNFKNAAASVPDWVRHCQAPAALARYGHFEKMHAEHAALSAELRGLGNSLYTLREQRAAADGELAGLEERLGQRRGRRNGEEYELARYLGSSLFRWELLRTKVAHHLALTFTVAKERVLEDTKGGAGFTEAESRLGKFEEELQLLANKHKNTAERRDALAKKLRSFLKSLVLSCEAAAGETPLESAISKRFHVLRGKRFGVRAQAAEEFVGFLHGAFAHGVPGTVALLKEVLAPYAEGRGTFVLPSTWKARPKIGKWWEWLEREGSASNNKGVPGLVGREEFERQFAAAKRRFSVRVSAGEPVVMAYLLWLLLEDALGAAAKGAKEEILALPSPADVPQVPITGARSAGSEITI